MRSEHERGLTKSIDWKIIVPFLLLVFFGWLNIYATVHGAEPDSIFDPAFRSGKQLIWIFCSLGLGAMVILLVSPKIWEVIATPSYLLVLFLLFLVIFVGRDIKGSNSWFSLGPISFQPAEISKITTALMLATLMSRQNFRIDRMRDLGIVGAVLLLPMLAILCEHETGSMLVYVGYLFTLYREGLSGWWIFALGSAILLFILVLTTPIYVPLALLFAGILTCFLVARRNWARSIRQKVALRRGLLALAAIGTAYIFSVGFVFNNILQEHQQKRIEVLLGLTEDPSGVGYNVNQSMIAIGSGGLLGKGYLGGTQTTYGFVPEQSTDFIFCTVGEEWGFLGCLAVIALYAFLIYRIVVDADDCREAFTRIYGYGVASCLFMHLFINVGMTVGLMPVIGIPLPLFSYGGSSLLTFTLMISIFLALYRQEKKYF